MSGTVEQQLHDAAEGGHVSEVSFLLRDHPEINVNWAIEHQMTPLHTASCNGHDEVVKLLLAHPMIQVNVKSGDGGTPLCLGVGKAECL